MRALYIFIYIVRFGFFPINTGWQTFVWNSTSPAANKNMRQYFQHFACVMKSWISHRATNIKRYECCECWCEQQLCRESNCAKKRNLFLNIEMHFGCSAKRRTVEHSTTEKILNALAIFIISLLLCGICAHETNRMNEIRYLGFHEITTDDNSKTANFLHLSLSFSLQWDSFMILNGIFLLWSFSTLAAHD